MLALLAEHFPDEKTKHLVMEAFLCTLYNIQSRNEGLSINGINSHDIYARLRSRKKLPITEVLPKDVIGYLEDEIRMLGMIEIVSTNNIRLTRKGKEWAFRNCPLE